MALTRRRRKSGIFEQLSLSLAAPVRAEQPVELMDVGYFTGVRMSTGVWWLTVGLPKAAYAHEARTPQAWWRTVAPELFTLHIWSEDLRYVQAEQDDDESPVVHYVTRAAATRLLRTFNEHYQDWRMEAWT